MDNSKDYEFLNTPLWLKYTHERYTPLDDIKYRLDSLGVSLRDWPEVKDTIQRLRRASSIPLYVKEIDKKFWFYPADCINKKLHQIESLGGSLFDLIQRHQNFKQEFLINAAVEEAITSAIYEGANSTRSKAKALISSGEKPKDKDEYMLINNYLAMKWIKENVSKQVSKDLILKVHEIVSQNTLEGDDANFSGKFRNNKVYVGTHEGIDYTKIEDTIDEVIELTTNNPRYLHGLIKGILLHYFTAYIHPFFDGNGRTARTLFYFKAMKNNLKFVELLSISANLKQHGKRYEKSFDLVKEHQLDLTYFIDFCLDSLLLSLKKVQEKVNFLITISELITRDGLSETQVSLLQKMALNKYKAISIEEYALDINKSREISRRELKGLKAKGYVTELKQGKKFVYKVNSKYLKEFISLIKK
ncbi:Fic family protein [Halobacteriovorax sp. ZH1_bin.1]|uniref:Fic family protein n=1 Tax=Halobacteriovorax sp. ZH1_bin.1 TaxID=3157723 RepID=UPI003724B83B